MLKRVDFGSSTSAFAIAAFVISVLVFIFFVVRALRMKRKHLQHMSRMPLDDQSSNSPQP